MRKVSRKIDKIILHCSATREGQNIKAETIRTWHLAQKWSDIGYHFVVDLDGTIEFGRDITMVGAHTSGENSHSIGICYVGGVDSEGKPKDTRTDAQRESLVCLVKSLMRIFRLKSSQVHAHYEYANKACPSFKIEGFRKELER